MAAITRSLVRPGIFILTLAGCSAGLVTGSSCPSGGAGTKMAEEGGDQARCSAATPPPLPDSDPSAAATATEQSEEASLLQRLRAQAAAIGDAAVGSGGDSQGEGSERRFFVWMTDVHADPYYNTDLQECGKDLAVVSKNPYGVLSCDPPSRLMESAADAAAKFAGSGVEFVAFTGDFVRHNMDQMPHPIKNVTTLIGNVSKIIKARFPKTQVAVGPLGNDDNPDDYFQNVTTDEPANPWFTAVGEAMADAGVMSQQMFQKYKYGSYSEIEVGGLTVLSIATVIYSVDHEPETPDEDDPFGQFAWLREKLAAAAHASKKVWIIGHIPPGIETYGYTALWQQKYVDSYLEIVQDEVLGSAVAAQLFGHVHKDEFRVLPNIPRGAGPIFLASAISPIYDNWPSFKLVEYCPTSKRLLNIKTFYAELQENSSQALDWKLGYDLATLYPGLPKTGIKMKAIRDLSEHMRLGLDTWTSYAHWYAAGYPNDLEGYATITGDPNLNETFRKNRRHQYHCAMTVQNEEAYSECVGSICKSLSPYLGEFKEILRSIPSRSLGDEKATALGRLINWALMSSGQTSSEIWKEAKKTAGSGEWEVFLSRFGHLGKRGVDLQLLP